MLTVLHDLLAGAYAGSAMFKFIGRILKGVWSCVDFTRRALANLILIALVCTVLVAVFWNQPTAIPAKSLLEINLAGNLVEHVRYKEQILKPVSETLFVRWSLPPLTQI